MRDFPDGEGENVRALVEHRVGEPRTQQLLELRRRSAVHERRKVRGQREHALAKLGDLTDPT